MKRKQFTLVKNEVRFGHDSYIIIRGREGQQISYDDISGNNKRVESVTRSAHPNGIIDLAQHMLSTGTMPIDEIDLVTTIPAPLRAGRFLWDSYNPVKNEEIGEFLREYFDGKDRKLKDVG